MLQLNLACVVPEIILKLKILYHYYVHLIWLCLTEIRLKLHICYNIEIVQLKPHNNQPL